MLNHASKLDIETNINSQANLICIQEIFYVDCCSDIIRIVSRVNYFQKMSGHPKSRLDMFKATEVERKAR